MQTTALLANRANQCDRYASGTAIRSKELRTDSGDANADIREMLG